MTAVYKSSKKRAIKKLQFREGIAIGIVQKAEETRLGSQAYHNAPSAI